MQRRALVAAIGVSAVAGCLQSDTDSTPTGSSNANGKSGSNEGNSDGEPSPEDLEAVRPDNLAVSIDSWTSASELRYYDASAEDLARVSASNGAFYSVEIQLRNLSGSTIDNLVEKDEFEIVTNGSRYAHIDTLPDGVEWDTLRQRESNTEFHAPDDLFTEELDPKEDVILTVVFDAASDQDFSLEWTYNNIYGKSSKESTTEEIEAP